jgi:hypothetical protein
MTCYVVESPMDPIRKMLKAHFLANFPSNDMILLEAYMKECFVREFANAIILTVEKDRKQSGLPLTYTGTRTLYDVVNSILTFLERTKPLVPPSPLDATSHNPNSERDREDSLTEYEWFQGL